MVSTVETLTVTETVVLIVVPPLQAIQLSDHIIEHGSFVSDPFPALSDALVVLSFGARLQLGSPDWGDWCFLSSLARWERMGRDRAPD